ncbi:MAG TPA: hypothetical protein VGB09_03975 [Candidatus Binatia bacterium]
MKEFVDTSFPEELDKSGSIDGLYRCEQKSGGRSFASRRLSINLGVIRLMTEKFLHVLDGVRRLP